MVIIIYPAFRVFCEFFGIFCFLPVFAPFYCGDFEASQKSLIKSRIPPIDLIPQK
jgi:hypothetical protein